MSLTPADYEDPAGAPECIDCRCTDELDENGRCAGCRADWLGEVDPSQVYRTDRDWRAA